MRVPVLLITLCLFSCRCLSQNTDGLILSPAAPNLTRSPATTGPTSDSIRILIIYGSKPAKGHPNELNWFGGRPGGHVGMQVGPDKVLSFRSTKYRPVCHILPRRKPRNFRSLFETRTVRGMWQTFNHRRDPNYNIDRLQRVVFAIPITKEQRRRIDSIDQAYRKRTPYDYAVLGMRCASATYEIMAQAGLFEKPWKHAIWWHLLYPRDIRYELEKEMKHGANGYTWRKYFYKGADSRVWDYDRKVK